MSEPYDTLRARWPGGWGPSLCPGCGAAIAYFRCRCPALPEPTRADVEAFAASVIKHGVGYIHGRDD